MREVLDLELGEGVPEDVSVLVIARPTELHPRTAFAVDQFLQRGGRALLCVDRVLVDLARATAVPVQSGLETALAAWGVAVDEALVWDEERSNSITTQEVLQVAGGQQTGRRVSIPFRMWPHLDSTGLSRETPVTAQLSGLDLFWAHTIVPLEVPPGIERSDLVWSSPTSFVVNAALGAEADPRVLSARAVELFATGAGASRVMAVSLAGRFPSPFSDGAPSPHDPIADALGDPEDAPRSASTNEPVLSAAADSQLVIVGDADWLSDGKFLTERNKLFFVNLIDWLALEDDLIALRSRVPIERKIDSFLEEERRALGLIGPEVHIEGEEEHSIARMEAQAARAAARRRWLAMAGATGGSLVLALALFTLWRLTLGRTPVVEVSGARPVRTEEA